MARVIEWATGEAPASERRFLRLAKSDLPDHWTVVHGLRIRRGRQDREIDFLVIDPARGALAIEVKGGRIGRRGPEWFSMDRDGERHPIKDPGKQVNAAVYALRKRLQESTAYRVGRGRAPRIHSAVAFPDVARTLGDLGLDLQIETVLFSEDLHHLEVALDRVFESYLMGRGSPFSQVEVDVLLGAIEPPEFTLQASVGARVDRNRRTIERLTEDQAQMLDFLEHQRRAAIEGAAGTGKTVLAELKATRLARMGHRVLLLCFNQALAEWLAARATGFRVKNFHGFCRERAVKAGLAFEPPKPLAKRKRFWEDTAPDLLLDALGKQPEERYDAIIVDEGQDFLPHWWLAVEEALSDERDGILFAFFDPNQDIYGGGPPDAFRTPPFSLTTNCRNTRRIATYAAGLIHSSCEVRAGAPNGARVKSLHYDRPEQMVDQVRRQLHRLVVEEKVGADRITVLSTHATNRSHLAHSRRLGNFHLVLQPRKQTDIRFTSLHAFKGLESDVVILVDVDGNPKSCSERHLYVAATRARALLIVLEERRAAA